MKVRWSWFALLLLASCSSTGGKALSAATSADAENERACDVVLAEGPQVIHVDERCAAIGDTILVTDARNRLELTLTKKIDIDGTILLPELGAVAVAGHTCSELERLLTQKWSSYFAQLDLHVEIVARVEREALPPPRTPVPWNLDALRGWLRELLTPPILIVGERPA